MFYLLLIYRLFIVMPNDVNMYKKHLSKFLMRYRKLGGGPLLNVNVNKTIHQQPRIKQR